MCVFRPYLRRFLGIILAECQFLPYLRRAGIPTSPAVVRSFSEQFARLLSRSAPRAAHELTGNHCTLLRFRYHLYGTHNQAAHRPYPQIGSAQRGRRSDVHLQRKYSERLCPVTSGDRVEIGPQKAVPARRPAVCVLPADRSEKWRDTVCTRFEGTVTPAVYRSLERRSVCQRRRCTLQSIRLGFCTFSISVTSRHQRIKRLHMKTRNSESKGF